MAFFSDAAQAALDEYQHRIVSVAIKVYRNNRPSSSKNIVIALGESFESIKASIIRFALQQDSRMPVQLSLNVAWQDDLPSGVNVATISKNTFLGDLTNLTYVTGENLDEVLCLLKTRGGKDTLLVTLDDAPGRGLAELRNAQVIGPPNSSEKRTGGRNDQSPLESQSNPDDVIQAFNPSAFLGGMFAAHRRGSAEARRKSTRDSSPRRRQGSTGWVDDDETYPRDGYDRSISDKAKPGTHNGDQRSGSAKDEDLSQLRHKETRQAKPGSALKKSDNPLPSMDLDENIHGSRRHLFGPRH